MRKTVRRIVATVTGIAIIMSPAIVGKAVALVKCGSDARCERPYIMCGWLVLVLTMLADQATGGRLMESIIKLVRWIEGD